jgi:hypothetical protein
VNTEKEPRHLVSRTALLKSGGVLAGSAALFVAASKVPATAGAAGTLAFDVACDGRTWRLNRADPTLSNQVPSRGDGFIVSGKIYPDGTIAKGLASPDQPGSIGTWICRGFFNVDIASGKVPHVVSTQLFFFDNGDGLINDGLENGIPTVRFVTGGMGAYSGARGYVHQAANKKGNSTTLDLGPVKIPADNIHFIYTLMP